MTRQHSDQTAINPLHAAEQPEPLTAFATMNELMRAYKDNKTITSDNENKNAKRNHFTYEEVATPVKHPTIVKRFSKESYNGPTVNDFVERLDIIYKAAQEMINASSEDDRIKQKKKSILDTHYLITKESLKKNCDIAPIPFEDLFSDLKKHEQLMLEQIKTATTLIGEFINNSLPSLKKNNQSVAVTKRLLAEQESKITVQAGRPNFINYYPSTDTDYERVSIQRVVGDAIPSTERNRSKLPNFVECSIGFNEIKETNGEYQEQFRGYRHSSYTPIKMEHKEDRAEATRATVKEMLTELARQKINEQSYKKGTPIEINFSSLALLSPIWMDKKIMPKGESEVDQLTECYDALMSFNKKPLVLTIDDNTITVTPNITVLNAPANGHGAAIHNNFNNGLMYRELRINAQGINQFAVKTIEFLLKNNDPKNYSTLSSIKKLFEQLQKDKVQLNPPAQENILDLEVKYYKQFTTLFNANREAFLDELNKAAENDSNKKDVANLAFRAIAMQIDRTLEPPQYGARYLLACQKMGDFVDFYCKSGEDRTGRMQNLIEELCEYKRVYEDYPKYENKKIIYDKPDTPVRIAQLASEFSVSKDINDQNAHGARGLQIGSDLKLNDKLPNNSGRALAQMAKKVYNVPLSVASKNYLAQTLEESSNDYQQIKKERKKLSVSDESDRLTLISLKSTIDENIKKLNKQLATLENPTFTKLLVLDKQWAPNVSKTTEKINLHIREIHNELKEYKRLLNKVTVAAGTKHYLYLGNGLSVTPIMAQDKSAVINTPDFSAKAVLTATKNNSDNTSLRSIENEQKNDLYYRFTTNYAGNNSNTIAVFDLSIEPSNNNSSHFKPNVTVEMIQPPTCTTQDQDGSVQATKQKPSLNSEIHSYISMALTILTSKEGIPTPEHPIIIENGTAKQREMLWTMLVLLGEKKFGFKPDALQVSAGEFSPDKIITKGFFGTSFAKESLYQKLTNNKDAMIEINRHIKDADKMLQDMKKGNARDFKEEIAKGRSPEPSSSVSYDDFEMTKRAIDI